MKSKLEEDDRRLFREAVRDVKPLPRPAPERRPARPRAVNARFSRADRHAVLQETPSAQEAYPEVAFGEELVFAREGIQKDVLRKLRRGAFRVQAEMDLHGMTLANARQALRGFLADALHQQWRCVRIIHGKGLRSGHRGPVLKAAVSGVLQRVGPVLAFVSARQVDGGTGALYVLLATTHPADRPPRQRRSPG